MTTNSLHRHTYAYLSPGEAIIRPRETPTSANHLPADALTNDQLVARIDDAYRATHPPRPCTEHRWLEVSRWGDPQRRWLRCSECGEAVEDAP